MNSQEVVTPVKTGVQRISNDSRILDSGFRRNDGKRRFPTSYDSINIGHLTGRFGFQSMLNVQ